MASIAPSQVSDSGGHAFTVKMLLICCSRQYHGSPSLARTYYDGVGAPEDLPAAPVGELAGASSTEDAQETIGMHAPRGHDMAFVPYATDLKL